VDRAACGLLLFLEKASPQQIPLEQITHLQVCLPRLDTQVQGICFMSHSDYNLKAIITISVGKEFPTCPFYETGVQFISTSRITCPSNLHNYARG
jgi:hypothetical protein